MGNPEYVQKSLSAPDLAAYQQEAEPVAKNILEQLGEYMGYWPLLGCAVVGLVVLIWFRKPLWRAVCRRIYQTAMTESSQNIKAMPSDDRKN